MAQTLVRRRRGTPPLAESDLASRDRARNAARVVEVAAELERVADVADAKVIRDEIDDLGEWWLRRLAAPSHNAAPSGALTRWRALFADELDTVWRAENTVRWQQYMTDGNLAAAANMAEHLLTLAVRQGRPSAAGKQPMAGSTSYFPSPQ